MLIINKMCKHPEKYTNTSNNNAISTTTILFHVYRKRRTMSETLNAQGTNPAPVLNSKTFVPH